MSRSWLRSHAVMLGTVILLGLSRCCVAAEQSGVSYPLFDGKTLNGWTVEHDCKVEVQDGKILLKSGDGWLRSDHVYGDFRLHVESMALQTENYDAGIYLRAGTSGKPFPKTAYQANLLQGKEGNISRIKGASSTGLAKPAGEWNSFDITVIGETVEMVINGKRAYKVGGLELKSGHVGIQIEVPKGGQFLLRNLRVTELEHQSLFNGKNLEGWEGAGGPAEACWLVKDGLLTCNGQKGPWLRHQNPVADFNLRFDYQVSPGGNSGVYVRVPADGKHHRANESQPPAGFEVQILDDSAKKYAKLKAYQYCGSVYDITGARQHVGRPPGEWNSLEINCHGHHITTVHNGVAIVDARPEEFPLLKLRKLKGYIGFQNHSTVVKFRRVRIGPTVKQYPDAPDSK